MSNGSTEPTEKPPDFREFSDNLAVSLSSPGLITRWWKAGQVLFQEVVPLLLTFVIVNAAKLVAFLARTLMKAEETSEPAFQELASIGIEDLFGVRVNMKPGGLKSGRKLGPNEARTLGEAVVKVITNTSGSAPGGGLAPSMAGAEGYLSSVLGMVVEGWVEGAIVDSVSLGYLGKFGDLDDVVYEALGFGRLSRRVLSPLVDATVVTPAQWHINKTYRPELLSESMAVRQFLRGRLTREQLEEELGRQGWSTERIDAHINQSKQRLSLEEEYTLFRVGVRTREQLEVSLREQGFDAADAASRIDAKQRQRYEGIEQQVVSPAVRAFADRRISSIELRQILDSVVNDNVESAFWVSAAHVLKDLNRRGLSHSEVREAVKQQILPRSAYRRWLETEGYDDADAMTLELLLAKDIQADIDAEQERQRIAEERRLEKLKRDEERRKRLEEQERERLEARRGPLSELRRAAVRGLIPFARVEEILRPDYDADTVAIFLEQLALDREEFLEQQRQREEAEQRAKNRRIDIGDLEAGVLNNILSLDEYAAALRDRQIVAEDVSILRATLGVRKADLDDARRRRDEALERARNRRIDLGRFESLVRRGHRSLTHYDALLTALDFEPGARAAMRELLELHIADDAEARRLREEERARRLVKGLSLEQMRRAVLLGTRTDEQFQTWLIDAGYTSEAQTVLLADLRHDVADAADARRRRELADARGGPGVLPLSTVARAARLSLIAPAVYQARLVELGYDADEVALELELLMVEIAETQAARAKRDALAAAAEAPKALTLAQLERAVKAGVAPIDAYRAAAALVYAPDDVDLVVATLASEVAALEDARQRKTTITGELAARTLSLGDLEAAVRKGALTFEQFEAQLVRWGYGSDDAALLAALLAEELSATES